MYLDDIKLNMEFETEKVKIDREKMIAFAKEYDPLPLHMDDDYAKNTRYNKIIAPGIMSFMSVWSKFVESDFFGDELVAGVSTKVEWFKPVYAEDILTGKAKITRIERRNDYNGIAEITMEIYNQNNELVMKDVTESVIRYRENKK